MGRKLSITSLFSKPNNNGGGDMIRTPSTSSSLSSSSSWAWPSCKQPRTDSFRCGPNIYKTANSVYYDSTATDLSLFSAHSSSELDMHSDTPSASDDEESEAVIRGLIRSDRLLFEPGSKTSSILERDEEASKMAAGAIPFKESVAMAMESKDPYGDFRRSMEEMVVAHGMRDWDCLEQLLVWYLRVNGKKNHGFIVGAFVDLLVALASSNDGPAEHETADIEKDEPSRSFSNSLSSMSFEIEEVDEGSGSC